MTVPQPRKPRNDQPERTRVGGPGNHVTVGRNSAGQLWVNVFVGVGVTAKISDADGEQLRQALGGLLGVPDPPA